MKIDKNLLIFDQSKLFEPPFPLTLNKELLKFSRLFSNLFSKLKRYVSDSQSATRSFQITFNTY